MKNHYSEIRLHQITCYLLPRIPKHYSQLLSTQFTYLETRLQSFANCSVQTYLQLLTNAQQSDCKGVIFNHHDLAVCNIANLVFVRSHPPWSQFAIHHPITT
jgi:hypothetical protein